MFSFLKRTFGSKSASPRGAARCRPQLEALEDRCMPAGITDMTALAASLVHTPNLPTHLYLNFDGFEDSTHRVAPYNGSAQTVNDIIYRVSEIFSPFNVEVSRLNGANRYDGGQYYDTTVFIGDDSANTVASGYPNLTFTNIAHAYTPSRFADHPGETLGDQHVPHSNLYNLAFVDPVGLTTNLTFTLPQTTDWDATQISQAIAHEAGHTFGLAHVLNSTTNLTFTLPQTTNDIMSYDSPNEYFADATFDITDLNNTAANGVTSQPSVVPKYDGTTLLTQNSFTYLEQVLGDRPDDGLSHVVHAGSVDPAHFTAPAVSNLTLSSVKIGTIDRAGDYVVYWLKALTNTNGLEVNVTPTGNGGLYYPNLLVYNNGELVQYDDGTWTESNGNEIHISVSLTAGQTYAFVIGGGGGGNATGGYRLQTKVPLDQVAGAVNKDVVGSWSNDAKDVFSDVISTVGTWTKSSGAKSPAYIFTGYAPAPVATTPIAPKPADVPVALTAADFSSLGSGASFVASAQEAFFQAGQAITMDAIADGTYGDAPIILSATSDSGLAVSYQLISGPAILTDNVLSITGAGIITIEATQAGDDVFAPATPVVLSFTVNKQAQIITMDAIADGTYGDAPIIFNGFASSGLAVSYQVISGPAMLTDNVLTITGAGVVTVEAIQAGDDNFEVAAPIDLSFTVNKAQLTVAADNQTRVFGQANPAFTTTITGFVNGEALDNSGIIGNADFGSNDTAASPVGTYAITASLGSLTADNYDFTNFVNGSLTVTKAGTTIGLNSSVISATVGQQVTLTATVAAYNSSAIPGGTVTFKDGSAILGTGTLSNGVATFKTVNLAAGSHTLTAVYAGTSNFKTSTSAALTQKVSQASKTTLQSSLATSTFGQAVTLTATVAPATGTVIPTGIVTFMDGAVALGTATLSNGKATLTTALLGAGSHAITVIYAGSSTFAGGTSAALTQTVKPTATTVALTSSATTPLVGQLITLTAKISVVAPGAGVVSGTVTFKDGTTVLGTGTLSNGVAVFQTAKLAVGSHAITVAYGGAANFMGSTSVALTETINKAAITVSLTSSATTALFGKSITLTAKISVVAPGAARPSGTITFKDGTTVLGTATIVNGVALFQTAKLSKGKHTLTVLYGGDANLTGSTSAGLTETIS